MTTFYLSCSDYGEPEVRKSTFEGYVKGRRRSDYILVKIEPPLEGFRGFAGSAVEEVILSPVDATLNISEIGRRSAMADVIVPPEGFDGSAFDEQDPKVRRIGVGTLHATRAEAEKFADI